MSHLIKQLAVTLFSGLCLLFSCISYADFNKALNAYINNQPQVLMSEVRESVSRSDTKGLALFINTIKNDKLLSSKVGLYRYSSNENKNSTIEKILSPMQYEALKKLLLGFARKHSVRAQFLLVNKLGDEFNFIEDSFAQDSKQQLIKNPTEKSESQIMTTRDKYENRLYKNLEVVAKNGSGRAALKLYQFYSESHTDSIGQDHPTTEDLNSAKKWLFEAARLNHPGAHLILGQKYLNYDLLGMRIGHFNKGDCEGPLIERKAVCLDKDDKRAEYHLMKLANYYQQNDSIDFYPYNELAIGNYFHNSKPNNLANIKQAYLWYLLAIKHQNPDVTRSVVEKLQVLYEAGWLNELAPSLEQVWLSKNKRIRWLNTHHSSEVPKWLDQKSSVIEVRRPVFSFIYDDFNKLNVDVFADGFVVLENSQKNKIMEDFYMDIGPKRIRDFLKELEAIRFYEWMRNENFKKAFNCYKNQGDLCAGDYYTAILYDRGIMNHVKKFSFIGRKGSYKSHVPEITKEEVRLEKLIALMEKYFPIQKIRCSVSNSKPFNSECNQFYKEISEAN